MISRIATFVLAGIEAIPCEVEAGLTHATLPSTAVVGLPDAAVRESTERVRSAILASRYEYPFGRVTVNLAPADLRKEGPVYDLPIAVATLLLGGTIDGCAADGGQLPDPDDFLFAGELALDGRVRPVRGVISLAMLAKRRGKRGVIVPGANAAEAAVVEGIEVYGASTLADVVGFLNGNGTLERVPQVDADRLLAEGRGDLDFGDVRGQEAAKRAMTIAAAGMHNVLLIGPAGSGKTMMARALPGILPPLTRDEALEVTRVYSAIGAVPRGASLITTRPVRTPHHTASTSAIVGGGTVPRPGEVSLAHHGVLFLDELPEFQRSVLEGLREPLEDGFVTISRMQGTMRFPARTLVVAAMNPTHRGDRRAGEEGRREQENYLKRLSGPLIDRVDLHVEVQSVPFGELASKARGSDSATLRERVFAALARSHSRQGPTPNARLSGRELDRFAHLDDASRGLLGRAMAELGLSARAYDKIRRVSRTIADLDGATSIELHHVAEAIQYRVLDRRV
ncbi:MAG: YifB family Mg chelatase-like AAA ATPase [Phycisphaerales bacterium]